MAEEKDIKDVEECTFIPNSRSKSAAKGQNRINYRNTRQFLEDQAKKEEERIMKISLQMEMNQMKIS